MVTRWDPFSDIVSVREAANRLLRDGFGRSSPQWGGMTGGGQCPFDLYETGDEVVVRLAAPGADQDRFELTVNKGVLTLKGHCAFYSGNDEQQYTWHARGLAEGDFQMAVSLPAAVNPEAAEAAYDSGILTVRLPKAETVKAKRIAVKGARTQDMITSGSA